jgi:hypothetical protein
VSPMGADRLPLVTQPSSVEAVEVGYTSELPWYWSTSTLVLIELSDVELTHLPCSPLRAPQADPRWRMTRYQPMCGWGMRGSGSWLLTRSKSSASRDSSYALLLTFILSVRFGGAFPPTERD